MIDLPDAESALNEFWDLLRETGEELASVRLGPEAWTLKEIVGHLVDSASNNHQRFIRLQLENTLAFPGYEAEPWVAAGRYGDLDWPSLITLWRSYNKLLLHLAATVRPESLGNVWKTDTGDLTLEFLMADYYSHLRLHISHYQTRKAEVEAALARETASRLPH